MDNKAILAVLLVIAALITVTLLGTIWPTRPAPSTPPQPRFQTIYTAPPPQQQMLCREVAAGWMECRFVD